MPLPHPRSGESREDWTSRCMGDDAMQAEFPDQDQRSAVCQREWENRDDEKAAAPEDIQVKALAQWEIKDEATGEVEAIVATLNVVDRDAEVITKDAIKSGSKVKMSAYAHDIVGGLFGGGGALPVGKGAIFVEKDKAVFRGKVFVSTQRGRDVMEVLKEMGPDQEWSFGFRVVGSEIPDDEWRKQGAQLILTKLEVFEVSPVVLGAGIGTRTLSAKSRKAAALAARAKEEEETAAAKQKEADEAAAAAKAAEEEAARAELERKAAEEAAALKTATEEAERKAAIEAEARRIVDEREAQRKAEEEEVQRKAVAEAERKRLEEVEAQRTKDAAIRLASTMEFEKFQRTMQKPFVHG